MPEAPATRRRRPITRASRGDAPRSVARTLLRLALLGAAFLVASTIGLLGLFALWADWRETDSASLSAPAEGRLVATPLGRLFVQEWGPADAPLVLMTHGTGAWSGFWAETARALAERGFRVVPVDLPPFGFSDHDREARYDRASQAARLVALLDALGACRAVLIGHSFGAGPVAEAMLRHPERLAGVVLVSAALALPEPDRPAAAPGPATRLVVGSSVARHALVAATLTNPLATRFGLEQMLARKEAATDARVAILKQPMNRLDTTAAYAAWLPNLMLPDRHALSMQPERWATVKTPLALVWGDADSITPLAQAERLARLVPGATLDAIAGVGHIPHIEASAETLALLVKHVTAMAARPAKPETCAPIAAAARN